MKCLMGFAAWCLAATLAAVAAEERFSQTVRPEEFSAAGLAKLSPAELERLDTLVRAYRSQAVAVPTSAASAPPAAAPSSGPHSAAVAEPAKKKSESGLLAKAKVILTPGTQVEYSTVESRIVGDFRGWQPRSTFTLENGQRWQVIAGSDSYVGPVMTNPAVKITPGMLGTFWLNVEGVRQRVKVNLISTE